MSDYNPNASLKTTKVIFTAIFIGPLIILGMFLLSFDFVLSESFSFISIYNIGLLAIITIGLPIANHYSKKILDSALAEDPIQSRIGKYQTSLIIKLASWEALALSSAVAIMANLPNKSLKPTDSSLSHPLRKRQSPRHATAALFHR